MANKTGPAIISDVDLYKSSTVASSVYNVGDMVEGEKGKKLMAAANA
jgi:hypothetical protein